MEHGILVIKPDGTDYFIKKTIEDKIVKANLNIIEEYQAKLTFSQAREFFNTNSFDETEYYSYLSGGDMIFFLIRGDYAISKLRNIKYEIRKKNFCQKSMKNLVHTCDTGNEYKNQLAFFFPNYNYVDYKLYADLHIPLQKYLTDFPNNASNSPNGIIINLNILNQKLCTISFPKQGLIGIRTYCKFGCIKIPLICYLKPTDDWYCKSLNLLGNNSKIESFCQKVKEINGLCIVDYIPFRFWSHDFVSQLKQIGVDGFKIYDLRYSSEQLEKIKYFVEYRYKMLFTGGSNSSDMLPLTIDQEIYEKIISGFKT